MTKYDHTLAELNQSLVDGGGQKHLELLLGAIVRTVFSTAAARLGLPCTILNAMMRKLGMSRKDL